MPGASLVISVAYSEIMIKGGNRRFFENLLIRNMLRSLESVGEFHAQKKGGRILLSSEKDFDTAAAKAALIRTFGLDQISIASESAADIKEIEALVISNSRDLVGKSIRVETKRADKGFPLNSQQINQLVGKRLVDMGCTVDLTHPQATVYIEILTGKALVSFEKTKGPGGLPVGSSGKVLSLLSGGIDSPVSSYLMMKRGCAVDFLHVHQFPRNQDAMDSKIPQIVKRIRGYEPGYGKIFLVPYTEFYKNTMSMDSRNELVLFRRFLLHLGEKLASKHGHKGLVTGDSIGQVASQTLENLFATDEASGIPVYRPLVCYNKQEIIDLAIKIGTYDLSIQPYKDCCSLVAHKNPSTKVPLWLAKKTEQEIGMEGIVEKTLEQTDVVELP